MKYEKSDLLKCYRYYKVEDDSHFEEQNKSMLWFYERYWVFVMVQGESFSQYIEDYIRVGLGLFEQFDDVPISLKALLFNRYAKPVFN